MYRPRTLLVLTAALAVLPLTACSTGEDPMKGEATIVTSFYPLAWVAERVAGEHFPVINLTQAGQEPHDLELGPRQVAEVADAALVVHEEGLQPAVDAAAEQNARGAVLDVSDVVELRPFADHSEEGHTETDDEHAHGDLDPHFWHDPLLMAEYADALAARLGAIDDAHAAEFTANAAALRTDLETLDREFTEGLSSCIRDMVVVNHDAFGYLARYGLHLEPIVGLTPDAEPTAATLSTLHDLIIREGVSTVFAETLVSRKTAETLAADLDVRTGVLDPIEGLSDATADEDYLSLMRANLKALTAANDCT